MVLRKLPIELSPESIEKVRSFNDRHETTYTLKEAAAITGKALYTLRRYMRQGELECNRVRGRVYFTEKQIEDFMKGGKRDG